MKEVFQLFSAPNDRFPGEKDGVIPREDVRKALVYVSVLPYPPSPLLLQTKPNPLP